MPGAVSTVPELSAPQQGASSVAVSERLAQEAFGLEASELVVLHPPVVLVLAFDCRPCDL